MASHCNPMVFSLRIPSIIVAFLRVRRWVVDYASMPFRHLLYKHKRNQEGWGLQPLLAMSLKNFNQKYQRLNLFWVGPKNKRGWTILKFAIRKSSSTTSHAAVYLLQSTLVSNSFYCVDCIHHTLATLPTTHSF